MSIFYYCSVKGKLGKPSKKKSFNKEKFLKGGRGSILKPKVKNKHGPSALLHYTSLISQFPKNYVFISERQNNGEKDLTKPCWPNISGHPLRVFHLFMIPTYAKLTTRKIGNLFQPKDMRAQNTILLVRRLNKIVLSHNRCLESKA